MSDFDPGVKAALERLHPPTSAEPDWADVLARRRRRTFAVAIGGAVAATAVLALAMPPLSLGERLFEADEEAPPPPARITEHFRWGNEAREQRLEVIQWQLRPADTPRVRVDETRFVLALDTSRGEAILWAAPAEDGRTCFIVQRTWETDAAEGPVESACTTDPRRPLEVHDVSSVRRRGDWLVAGVIGDGLELELQPNDGAHVRVADGFFVAELPPDAHTVDVLARSGDEVVARQRVHQPPKRFFERPPPDAYRVATIVDVAPGVPFGFGVATTVDPPTVCLAFLLGKEQRAFLRDRIGLQGGCGLPPPPAGPPVHWDLQEDLVYGALADPPTPVAVLYGAATSRVDSLEIRYEDGKRQAVELHRKPLGVFDRYFVFSIPKQHFARGHVPWSLIGRGLTGRVVYSERLG